VTILSIATSTAQVGVALSGPEGLVGAVTLRVGRRHGEVLAPTIDSLARVCGVDLAHIELVAVDVGPGLFTGLRVGVATAKALASGLGIPLAGCSSLDLLAHPHRRDGRTIVSVVDARRSEVFWAVYTASGYKASGDAMVREEGPFVSPPAELAERLPEMFGGPGGVLLAGDGARRYAEVFAQPNVEVAPQEFDHPSAEVLAALAPDLEAGPPEVLAPLYLRGADVRIGWERRGA
jgi:tRNA threonylcarbamoyladenosine biosynthesis protein TsaB